MCSLQNESTFVQAQKDGGILGKCCSFYEEVFHPDLLHTQLVTFGRDFQAAAYGEKAVTKPTIFDI